jgi:hypothetical protein
MAIEHPLARAHGIGISEVFGVAGADAHAACPLSMKRQEQERVETLYSRCCSRPTAFAVRPLIDG